MLKKNAAESLKERLGFANAFAVGSIGRAGGLCIFWTEDVKFTLVSFSQNHICGDIDAGSMSWRFVGIYGWPKEEDKHKTWSLLRHLCEESPLPLLIGGDFNEIMSYGEKEGGVDRNRRAMVAFRETVDDLMLRDLGFVGPWYTWERGNTAATRIRERLDRFLCSASWFDLYSDFVVDHLLRYKSDHVAMVLRPQTHNTRRKKNRGFRFEIVGY
ncbi:uncharacterized protein LOC130591483 [Beta vulgaris subsp. vulgaris]|uniref:uncharacterized protein LOC130591483 n=1 Tax=Beta vulgaris subsp. vulgaris TaxID=3555 RepID=UPI00254968E4|nr:uncharacterized protein LOC130591483 [Beta vulgaris subsp. vulgaris]